jgi:hypothetical protein
VFFGRFVKQDSRWMHLVNNLGSLKKLKSYAYLSLRSNLYFLLIS